MTTRDQLREMLSSTICHITSPEGWKGILATGAISPNDGRFADSFPQSANSYARKKPAVALFDFARAEPQHMADHWWKCEPFLRRYSPATYALILDRAQLPSPLIDYDEATAEFGHRFVKIPYLEVWSVQPIPKEAVVDVIVILGGRYRTLAASDARLTDAASLMNEL